MQFEKDFRKKANVLYHVRKTNTNSYDISVSWNFGRDKEIDLKAENYR